MMCVLTRSAATLIALGFLAAPSISAQRPADLLGRWHGTSICVRADWNAACHDEEAMYDFDRSPTDSTHLLLHAGKIVNGALVPMGDLDLAFEDSTASWVGEFANARVHIEWRYTLAGGTLTGTLLELPDRRVARRVTVTRVSGAGKD